MPWDEICFFAIDDKLGLIGNHVKDFLNKCFFATKIVGSI